MKINGTFVLREVAGENILIPTGKTALTMNGMVTMDPVGACIWKAIGAGQSKEQILKAITDRFEVDEATARADMDEFIGNLEKAGLVTE